jgi:predicted SAM-dependent methyltransferase
MRRSLRNVLKEGMFGEPVTALQRSLHKLRRRANGIDRKTIERYLAQHEIRKLHLGCGFHLMEGWLNSDYFPKESNVIHIDATGVYPFPDGTFDYAYSEHMIEHVPYPAGHSMLKESWRVLKDGGKMRLSTPNLAFLIALYESERSELQEEYIRRSSQDCRAALPCDTFVINNFVRAWRHQFIYDEKVLRFSMEQAGFVEITKVALNESEDPALRNLENEHRSPPGFIRLESLLLEGTKRTSKAPH